MLKLMQLKYPTFPGRLSSYQSSVRHDCPCLSVPASSIQTAQEMYRDHCYYASDYTAEIRAFGDSSTLAAADRVVQFPFVAVVCW